MIGFLLPQQLSILVRKEGVMAPTYWLNLFSYKSWTEFLDAGGQVTGFREGRAKSVRRIKPGDLMLCYLTGVSRFIGLLEVKDRAFTDTTPIWEDAVFPERLPVRVAIQLEPETAVPITDLKTQLSIFENLSNPHAWTGRLRGSPAKWRASDGEAIVAAMRNASANPVRRPFDPAKLARRPPILRTSEGQSLTVPDNDDGGTLDDVPSSADAEKAVSTHTEIQWLLAKLGNDMGLNVWVARNDRNRDCNGQRFTELPGLLESLPVQFDVPTTKTIELIDVLWLDGNSISAAFEIESTTSVYSGLLRMADLVSMQPNLSIPIYLVAPDDRRNKVRTEINRPTFSKLKPPLVDICRYISFSDLRKNIESTTSFIKHMQPQFLNDFAEECVLDDG
ncbi:EVE domain-containing protein [Pelagibius sp.]|uniref:EVE domain-containing protein n=1 Tax=Pelagibius sp. TaxID=1931238 RepID=UPI00263294C5|nr:EVE domain-containing protein [Pelagibius sp.]